MNQYTQHRHPANAYLVRERDRRRMRELGVVFLCLLALGSGLMVDTWLELQALKTGYRIEELRKELDEQRQTLNERELEEAYLSSPRQIWRRAERDEEMTPVVLSRVVILEKP